MTTRLALPVGFCLTLAMAGCGGDGDSAPGAPVATVTVTPNPADVDAGETVQLTATLRDADGNELRERIVAWSTSASTIATVSGSGLVSGVAEGSATITATSENQSGSTALTVNPGEPAPTGIRVLYNTGGKEPQPWLVEYDHSTRTYDWVDNSFPVPGVGAGGGFFPGAGLRLTTAASRAGVRPPPGFRVLFTGGDGAGTAVAVPTAVLYDPVARQATELEMVAARVYHTMTPLSSSRALIAGGDSGTIGDPIQTLASAEIFDLAASQFTATGSMNQARSRHAAAPLADGRVLITGGLTPGGGGISIEEFTAEVFDPESGAFTPTGSMALARSDHTAIALDDGRVLVVGGHNRSSAEVYDPESGTFSFVEDMEVAHGLGHRAVKLLDGRVLVLGGDAGVIQPSAVVEVFDPATDEFTRVADMGSARMLHAAVLIEADGTVLVSGGQDDNGDILDTAELYDPEENTWTPVGDLPAPASEQAGVYVPE